MRDKMKGNGHILLFSRSEHANACLEDYRNYRCDIHGMDTSNVHLASVTEIECLSMLEKQYQYFKIILRHKYKKFLPVATISNNWNDNVSHKPERYILFYLLPFHCIENKQVLHQISNQYI